MKRRGRQKKNRVLLVVLMAVLLSVSCGKRYVPRPYGYWRIEIPDTAYTALILPIQLLLRIRCPMRLIYQIMR